MKNKIVISILIIIVISISTLILYPDIKEFIKINNDHKYYQSIMNIEKDKENEEDNVKNNLSELEALNSKTNQAKKDIESLTKNIGEKNTKLKEINNKINNLDSNIKKQENEKERIKKMFE